MLLKSKLSIWASIIGATIAVPSMFALNIKDNKEKMKTQNIDEMSDEQDSGYSITLKEKLEIEVSEQENLCKEVIRSEEYKGKLMACRIKGDDSKVKFSYIDDLVVDTYPYEITSIRFTYNSVLVELKETLEYSNSKLFSSSEEILQGRGIIQINNSGKKFSEKDCKIEWLNKEQKDWIVRCDIK